MATKLDDLYKTLMANCIEKMKEAAKEMKIEEVDEGTLTIVANELVKMMIYLEGRMEELLYRTNVLQSLSIGTAAALTGRDPEEAGAEMKELHEHIEALIKRNMAQAAKQE